MIQANELRIGNWAVNYGQYVCIEADDIVDCHHQPESYEPIPLTPEILEKAGFKKSESDFWVKDGKPSFQWGEGNDEDWFITYQTQYGLDWNDAYHVRALHQLQNLYFAITGEELEINL